MSRPVPPPELLKRAEASLAAGQPDWSAEQLSQQLERTLAAVAASGFESANDDLLAAPFPASLDESTAAYRDSLQSGERSHTLAKRRIPWLGALTFAAAAGVGLVWGLHPWKTHPSAPGGSAELTGQAPDVSKQPGSPVRVALVESSLVPVSGPQAMPPISGAAATEESTAGRTKKGVSPTAAPSPAKPPAYAQNSELGGAGMNALRAQSSTRGGGAASSPELLETPSYKQLNAALAASRAAAANCVSTAPVPVTLQFQSSGELVLIEVGEPAKGTSAERCIMNAFRGVRLPAFLASSYSTHMLLTAPATTKPSSDLPAPKSKPMPSQGKLPPSKSKVLPSKTEDATNWMN